jgi:hypothetical protein
LFRSCAPSRSDARCSRTAMSAMMTTPKQGVA